MSKHKIDFTVRSEEENSDWDGWDVFPDRFKKQVGDIELIATLFPRMNRMLGALVKEAEDQIQE